MNNASPQSSKCGLCPIVNLKLSQDALYMRFNGFPGNTDFRGYLLIVLPQSHQVQDLALASGEAFTAFPSGEMVGDLAGNPSSALHDCMNGGNNLVAAAVLEDIAHGSVIECGSDVFVALEVAQNQNACLGIHLPNESDRLDAAA